MASWWLAGNIGTATVLGAYQALGAASLAASYSNLASPGTNDLTAGVAPAWSTNAGWTFDGAVTYLVTAFDADDIAAVLVQYQVSAAHGGVLLGARTAVNSTFEIYPWYTDGKVYYCYGGQTGVAPYLAGGNLGLAAGVGYRNGAADGAVAAGLGRPAVSVYVGGLHFLAGMVYPLQGSIQAIAFYSTAPTAAQIAAVYQEMATLGLPAAGVVSERAAYAGALSELVIATGALADLYACRGATREELG